MKRKIRNDENETPKKNPEIEKPETKIILEEKKTAQKEDNPPMSSTSLHFRSSICLEK